VLRSNSRPPSCASSRAIAALADDFGTSASSAPCVKVPASTTRQKISQSFHSIVFIVPFAGA